MSLSVLIVDDEPVARERLREMLQKIPDTDVAGSAESGPEAVEAIRELAPDLVLLDIEMPKVDGFDVVEQIARDTAPRGVSPPLIAFVTAYPQFAVDAFETGALDFLCKPVRLARLEQTLGRARAELARRGAMERLNELAGQLDSLRQARRATEEQFIWVQHRGEMAKVSILAIDWIQAEAEYVRLHMGDRSYLLRSSIGSLADELADAGFMRIHRSFLVHSGKIRTIRSTRVGARIVTDAGVELPVGRKYRSAVLRLRASA
jgi:DNA-binding LytR/AlgR family response regulator